MNSQKAEPILYSVLALLLLLAFIADFIVPLGIAVWVIYLFPIALAYLVWRPQVPLLLASIATVLTIVGYFFGPAGIDPSIAQINRIMGVLTAWVVAGTGYFFIRGKLAVRREEWLQTGHVGLAEKMSGELRLDQLGENILCYLAEYLGAQAGALFVQEEDAYRRQALYGAPASAPIPELIRPGDGLLGQAIRDRRSFLLPDVPDNYLYFGSALGQGKPRSLLIAPAECDGEINAVLELGFAGEPHETCGALLQRVSESIGVAVRSAKYRTRLQELLEETQRQAEELQAQSEELRSTNEELEEQSRVLRESQSKLEEQQSELEETNAQLEEQAQLLEVQRDDLSRAQGTLQGQARDLELASRYKSEFLANMSHELRTPLNSLLIMARLLAENRTGSLTSEQVQYATTIESSGNDLLTLINDILDISKIEAGRLDLVPQRMRIAALLERLKAIFQPAATEKGLEFSVQAAGNAPTEIEADPQRLEQVLKNFLSNAIKFTEKGAVTIEVGRAGDSHVTFTVRDTGIGIAPEQQGVIFDAFQQADGTINRKYGGTGLGLSISRELARLLAGEIAVESAAGQGSAFTLTIPKIYDSARVPPREALEPTFRSAAEVSSAKPATDARTVKRRAKAIMDDREQLRGDAHTILIVEDDPAFAGILCDLAHELGFQCLVADLADDAVLLARQYMPHAVVLDIGLPDHTGLTVLDRLKRDTRTRHMPIHVISVDDYTSTALSFGAVGYMLKPVKREELAGALEVLEKRLTQRLRRVLIVEDDPTQLRSLQLLLGSRDVETIGAASAAECQKALADGNFDCMVLDLTLPDTSGFEILEQLRHIENQAIPPVIVYTGKDLTADEELRLRKVSKSIIIKGAKSPERLLDEVTLFLHQVVSDLPADQQKMLAKSLNRDAALEGRHILVVEDDVRGIFSLTSIFEPHGVILTVSRNGREALRALELAAAAGRPVDMVLMDVMMPEMDGLTATREMRSRPEWKNIPVIMLTAKAMPDDQEQCLAAGASDYLAKPLNVDKLLSLARVWMPR